MNYTDMIKTGRMTAVREFFQLHGYQPTEDYIEWFYENFLGICKNMGYLYGNHEPLDNSPYATFALQIYKMSR